MMTSTVMTHQPQMQTRTVSRPQGNIVVDCWQARNPSGVTPILLVHGWGGTGSYWAPTAQQLAQTADVYVPDLPGTGRSQPVDAPQNMYDQVASLLALLDALKLDRVQIVGHSMGGAMSVLLAAEHPERVERLVLTSVAFFMTDAQKRFYHTIMRVYQVSLRFRPDWLVNVPGMAHLMGRQYFYQMPDDNTLLRQGLTDYLQLDRETAIACAYNATDEALPAAGRRLTVPTLLIAPRNDNAIPTENVDYTARLLAEGSGACDVHWIDECGHLPMVEKPDVYMTLLRDFLVL